MRVRFVIPEKEVFNQIGNALLSLLAKFSDLFALYV